MKKPLLVLLLSFSITIILAQPIPPQSIQDSVLGWMKVYQFKGEKESLKVDAKFYSVAQLSICDSFVNWMQATYIPKGGLGDAKKAVSEKLGLYNQNDAALPQSYGAYTKTYTELKYNSNHKMEPMTNSHLRWSIMVNAVPGIPADIFCTPTQYYFTIPTFKEQGYDNDGSMAKHYGLETNPNTSKYFSYIRRNSVIGNEKVVLLYKDYKPPFINITKGEYLQIIASTITREYEKEKKKIYEQNAGDQKGIDYFMKYLNDRNEKRLAAFNNNKEKYKNRLQETAEIYTDQPDIFLEQYPDVFEGNGGRALKLPIYKIDPAIAELCKTDKPQWIRISWSGEINDPAGKYHHESIINNFDFAYVYNFFFDPVKVKGQPYKPLHSPQYKEVVVASEASPASKKIALDKDTYFFEDFSTSPVGKKPIGWNTRLAPDGTTSTITKLDGLDGNWALMAGNYSLATTQLKKPFPQNFTLSYELIASQNFTWGAKGLTFQLSKESSPDNAESYIKLKLRPGFDGRPGDATIETKFPTPPEYLNTAKWMEAPGFSNNKKFNRITVTIKKSDEKLQVFIDKIKIAEYEKAIPTSLLFNALSFNVLGDSGENDKFYISNIKIIKE
jgi:hypothetical protein